jgi:hypothetical protein
MTYGEEVIVEDIPVHAMDSVISDYTFLSVFLLIDVLQCYDDCCFVIRVRCICFDNRCLLCHEVASVTVLATAYIPQLIFPLLLNS